MWPFEPIRIDTKFGESVSYGPHEGIDASVAGTWGNQDCGTSIKSISKGTCVHTSHSNLNYGNMAVISTVYLGTTYFIRYCHLQDILVQPSDLVNQGQLIGRMGSTGNSTACHIHLDIWRVQPPTWRSYGGNTLNLLVDPEWFINNYKEGDMAETITVNKADWDRLFKASVLGDRLINGMGESGNIADKSESKIDELARKPSEEYQRGFNDGKAQATPAPIDISKWDENGLTVETIDNGKKTTLNYKRKP